MITVADFIRARAGGRFGETFLLKGADESIEDIPDRNFFGGLFHQITTTMIRANSLDNMLMNDVVLCAHHSINASDMLWADAPCLHRRLRQRTKAWAYMQDARRDSTGIVLVTYYNDPYSWVINPGIWFSEELDAIHFKLGHPT